MFGEEERESGWGEGGEGLSEGLLALLACLPVVVLGVEDEVDGHDGRADRHHQQDQVHQEHEVVHEVEPGDWLIGWLVEGRKNE